MRPSVSESDRARAGAPRARLTCHHVTTAGSRNTPTHQHSVGHAPHSHTNRMDVLRLQELRHGQKLYITLYNLWIQNLSGARAAPGRAGPGGRAVLALLPWRRALAPTQRARRAGADYGRVRRLTRRALTRVPAAWPAWPARPHGPHGRMARVARSPSAAIAANVRWDALTLTISPK
ncbi:unnamed protein product [Chrysodeixis includens]|uniref:Uncharacterized protein n=1 Tax=Chrysodeixis includens TaxID=689277 RepID=A0A9N8KYT0_CHRIL|nr:unnamed protein product [Chrysodeixis includens]